MHLSLKNKSDADFPKLSLFFSCCCKSLNTFSSASRWITACGYPFAEKTFSPNLLDSFMDWMLLKTLVLLYPFPSPYKNKLLQYNHYCVGEVCRQHEEEYSALHVQIHLKRCNVSAYTIFYY